MEVLELQKILNVNLKRDFFMFYRFSHIFHFPKVICFIKINIKMWDISGEIVIS